MYLVDPTMLLVLAGLALGLWAQYKVKSAYEKYSKIPTAYGRSASQVVQELLFRQYGSSIAIAHVSGEMTDFFDPRTDTLSLSDGVYSSSSIAAVGIAAHEAGHAIQKMENYGPLKLRSVMVPVVNIGSTLSWPLFLGGLVLSLEPLQYAGIALFGLVVLFSLITLPVELDASRRAGALLAECGCFTQEELSGVKSVLTAAAMTYVASFISALLQLLRLILLSQRRRR